MLHSVLPCMDQCIYCAVPGLDVVGGEGAPDFPETLQNFGINVGAVALLGTVVRNDVRSKQKAMQVTNREETMGLLQVGAWVGGLFPVP